VKTLFLFIHQCLSQFNIVGTKESLIADEN